MLTETVFYICRRLVVVARGIAKRGWRSGCGACLVLCVPAGVVAEQRPPNVVVLLADDLGYGELGCQGREDIPTPHIDSLAANGARCVQGYVAATYCSPSRAGSIPIM